MVVTGMARAYVMRKNSHIYPSKGCANGVEWGVTRRQETRITRET